MYAHGRGLMADVQQQLSTLLGTRVKQLRTTEESPPNISVIDVVAAITGLSSSNAAVAFTRLKNEHPDVTARCSHVKFRDSRGRRGQKDSPACDVRGIVEIIMLLPGRHAAHVRRQAAELLVRYLGGDLGIISEVCALRGLQEELAVRAPEDPRRVFGEAVEVASGSSGAAGNGLSHMFSALQERLSAQINERFAAYARAQAEALARIQERLDDDLTTTDALLIHCLPTNDELPPHPPPPPPTNLM